MRLTKLLFRQHIGWHAKMKWRTQRNRTIPHETSLRNLNEMGLPVVDAVNEFIPDRAIPDPPLVKKRICLFFLLISHINNLFDLIDFDVNA